jgi:hypothetical protein
MTDNRREDAHTPPFRPVSLAELTEDAAQALPTSIVQQMASLNLTPTTMDACPRSTVHSNGPQFGAVFGQQSSGGKGSLSYDEVGDKTVEDVKDASIDLLKSPRQTRAPPGTPQCGDLADFWWEAGGTVSGKQRSVKPVVPPTLWGLPYSDTFGTLQAFEPESTAPCRNDEQGEDTTDEQEQDHEGNKENRPPVHGHTPEPGLQRRNSFFSFHLSSSLMRASRKLRTRNSVSGTEE